MSPTNKQKQILKVSQKYWSFIFPRPLKQPLFGNIVIQPNCNSCVNYEAINIGLEPIFKAKENLSLGPSTKSSMPNLHFNKVTDWSNVVFIKSGASLVVQVWVF